MLHPLAPLRDLDDYLASVRAIAAESARQLAFLAAHTVLDEGEFGTDGEYSSQEIATASR